MQERRAPEQHSQHGVEGRAPHRAEAFVAMRRSEDRSQAVTTHHTTGMTTGLSQIQPDTWKGQQNTDWTRRHQRTNRGGGQDRGERSQERTGQTEATPHKAKTSKATEEEKQQQLKANTNPQHHKNTTRNAHRPNNTRHTRTNRAGRSK